MFAGLLRRPGYSVGIVLTLGIGIALSAGMFTVLRGVVLQGLPYPGGERVVAVTTENLEIGVEGGNVTPAEALALSGVDAFEHAGWFTWGGLTVLSGDAPREVGANQVSADYFRVLGIPAMLGRWIDERDADAGIGNIVLSFTEWDRLTGRDPDAVGKPIRLADATATIVGVMPPEFTHPSRTVGMWHAARETNLTANPGAFLNARYVNAIAKLAPGVTPAQAHAQLDAMSDGLAAEHGLSSGWRVRTVSLLDQAISDVRGALVGIFIVSLVVLAIACANASGLLAARLAARRREVAVMQALGATRGRVWRGVFFEMLILGMLASLVALGVLAAGLDAFKSLAEGIVPLARMIGIDWQVLAFAVSVAVVGPLLVTLPFAFGRGDAVGTQLKGGGKGVAGGQRGVSALPIAGLALATAAVIAGGAMLYSFDKMQATDPGFRADGLQAVQMFKGGGPDTWRTFANAVADEMRAQYDVEDVAITTATPLSLVGSFTIDLQLPERELPEPLQGALRRVSPNYLDLFEIPLMRGRGFTDADDAAAPNVAIINETLARRVFGDIDPIGREVALPLGRDGRVAYRVVGIMGDIRNAGLRNPTEPEVLLPFMQSPWVGMTFVVDAPRAGDDLIERLQQAIWKHDPQEATTRIFRLEDDLATQSARVAFFGRTLAVFAVLAAMLAAFGTYSVIALIQQQRTAEIGIRLALGADPARIARQVLRVGTNLSLVAGVLGSLLAFAVLQLMASQLYGITAMNPGLYVFGVVAVTVTALAASAVPAWRAARIAPIEALHHE
ncbi:MAG: ABC transporter permease [Gammaproteobacteria bacterium]